MKLAPAPNLRWASLILVWGCGTVAGEGPPVDGGKRDAATVEDASSAEGGKDTGGCDSGQAGVQCLAVAGPTQENGAIAVDNQNVYWAATGQTPQQGVILRASRSNGATVTLADALANALATDGVDVYWTNDVASAAGSIRRVPVNGGTVVTVASASTPNCIAVDDVNVYWSEVMTGSLVQVAKTGGTPLTLAHTTPGTMTGPMVVDATNVYWAPLSLMKVSKEGGELTAVWEGAPSSIITGGCRSLAIVGATLLLSYFVGQGSPGVIGAFPVTGATGPTILVSGNYPAALVANPANVFWLGHTSQVDIDETPMSGGATVTLARAPDPQVNDLVLASDGTLYWTGLFQVQSLKP